MSTSVPTTALLSRRFLAEYARTPSNLLFLVLVPIVFVIVAADILADAGRLLGGAGGGVALESVTPAWAAGFLTAVAMFFQVSASHDADRRLVLAGLPRRSLVITRLLVGAAVAALAATASLAALWAQAGVDDPLRVVAGTAMTAVIYLGLGAVAGATVTSPVNGTVLLLFVWILDVFFGPALNASDSTLLRVLPTHYVSLWTMQLPTGHPTPAGAGAMAWMLTATVAAFVVVWVRTAVAPSTPPRRRQPGSWCSQLSTGLRMAGREWRRTPVLAVLLVVVPVVFIWLADLTTPHGHTPVSLREGGRDFVAMLDPAQIHAGTMTPIAVGSLAALAGVFIVLDAASADQRLVLAGQGVGVVLATRLGLICAAAAVATTASLAVAAVVFEPRQWAVYVLGNALVALSYALVGVLLGRLFGRVSGTFMAFLIPFLDLGIGQSPMLQGEPRAWAEYLPGFGSVRVLLDGALTGGFDEGGRLLIAGAWILGLTVAVTVLFRFGARAARAPKPTESTGGTGGTGATDAEASAWAVDPTGQRTRFMKVR